MFGGSPTPSYEAQWPTFRDPGGARSAWFTWVDLTNGFANGAAHGAREMADAVLHPIQTLEGVGHAVAHPIATLEAVAQQMSDTAAKIRSGDPGEVGNVLGEAAVGIATGAVGKGASTVKGIAARGRPGSYTPDRVLPTDKRGVPTPDSSYPHTQLGRSKPKYGSEPQAREWDYGSNGNLQPKRDIDFTDHGTPSIHPNPHQHALSPNNPTLAPQGGFRRGPQEPL